MYINFDYIKSKDINPIELVTLICIRQMKWEPERVNDLAMVYNDTFEEKMSERGFITSIKGNKKDSELSKLRLTKKAIEFLDNAEAPEVTEDSIILFNWLRDYYKKLDKEVGNAKKTKTYIARFSAESGIQKNNLVILIQDFLNNEQRMEYQHKLEYLFFKPEGVFNTRFDINQSRLYQYWLKHKERLSKKMKDV